VGEAIVDEEMRRRMLGQKVATVHPMKNEGGQKGGLAWRASIQATENKKV